MIYSGLGYYAKDIDYNNEIVAIANQMKKSYVNWNRDSVEDKLIIKQLEKLSNGQLSLAADTELTDADGVYCTICLM